MASKENRGAVWPNKQRRGEQHPHWRGEANIDGKDYWVSAWKKADDAKETAPSISFAFQRKDEPATGNRQRDDFDDEVPF